MSHLFFSLSLTLFSLASKMKNEKRREKTVSRSNVWILNFLLSLFFTSRSLSYDLSFFAREREREREFSFYALTTL